MKPGSSASSDAILHLCFAVVPENSVIFALSFFVFLFPEANK